jgi:hypothetical protein
MSNFFACLQDTNPSPGDVALVVLTLGVASNPTITLDAVEAVTLLVPEIIVNSTGDLPNKDPNGCCCDTGNLLTDGKTPECTLRAAIDLANRQAGKDIIKFQIPSDDPGIVAGVSTIQPQAALPLITDPVVIDGWSQNASASLPPVELSGSNILRSPKPGNTFSVAGLPDWPGAASGLELTAASCEIRGLVITYFPMCGILAHNQAVGTIIQGCHVGITSGGTIPAPNGSPSAGGFESLLGPCGSILRGAGIALLSPGNLVGGTGPKEPNLISGTDGGLRDYGQGPHPAYIYDTQPPGILIEGPVALGNLAQGNIIGLDVTGTRELAEPPAGLEGLPSLPLAGVVIDGSANGNVVGGPDSGAGNLISANWAQVAILNSDDNVVQGNSLGLDVTRRKSIFVGDTSGVMVSNGSTNVIGGALPADGNVIGGQFTGIQIAGLGGQGNVVQNNLSGVASTGEHVPNYWGITLANNSGGAVVQSNVMAYCEYAGLLFVQASSVAARGNTIHDNDQNGIVLLGGASQAVTLSQNLIYSNGWASSLSAPADGIQVDVGSAIAMIQNSIFGNTGLGINLHQGDHTPSQNEVSGSGSGRPGGSRHAQRACGCSSLLHRVLCQPVGQCYRFWRGSHLRGRFECDLRGWRRR